MEIEVEVEVEVDVLVEVEVEVEVTVVVVVVVLEQPGTLLDFVVAPVRPASLRIWMRYELALALLNEARL